ncbi:MAG: N-acetyldiaminopimelate deacetylase [Myxococcota bacterium]|nr:N-acetyldiaminopimelate deacetylase [Myxococcota bacterium]
MASSSTALFQEIDRFIDETLPRLLEVRHHIHAHPELSWHEYETAAFLARHLKEAGLQPREGLAGPGFTAEVEGVVSGPAIGYRCDMDALPVMETSGNPWSSTRPGVMHACGHDLHSTVGLGMALIAARFRGHFPGSVRFLFQAAEEVVPSGADAMCKAGAVDGIEALWALHVDPRFKAGQVGLRYGVVTAAADLYRIRIIAQAGHSSRPYLSRDGLLMAAKVIEAIYQIVPTRIDPLKTAVVNVGMTHGGGAPNVICGQVDLAGTIRTFDKNVRDAIPELIREIAGGIVRSMGGEMELELERGSPPLYNDEKLVHGMHQAAKELLGDDNIFILENPSTGGEDFSCYSAYTRTAMLRLGARLENKPVVDLHHQDFEASDGAIRVALRLMSRSLINYLINGVGR